MSSTTMVQPTQDRSTPRQKVKVLIRLWRGLTEPAESVQKAERRRQMRFLSTLLIILIPLSMAGTLVSHVLTTRGFRPFQDPGVMVITLGCALLTAAYFLGRSEKFYMAGATITLSAFSLGSLAMSIVAPQDLESLVIYLALAILLGSLLLPLRGTVYLAAADALAVLLLPLLSPRIDPVSVVNTFIFVALMSVLITVSANIHRRHLQQIEQQSQILSKMYAASEQHARDLQRINNRVEAILDSVGEGLMVISLDGHIQQTNPAFEEQTGYRAHEVFRRHHQELLLDRHMSPAMRAEANRAMDAGLVWRGETLVERKDGTTCDMAVTIAPVRGYDGQITSFSCSLRDISALKEVQRLRDAFASNVSHELRTPIASLKIYLKLMATAPSDKRDKYLATMEREITRLHTIIEDVLRISRLDQKRVELHVEPLDLNELACHYVSDRASLAESEGLEMSFAEGRAVPPVGADEGLLGQVLGILLTNATNYTPPGGRVTVSTGSRQVEGRTWAGFSVHDTGPGIPCDEQARLFHRFFRGQAGRDSGKAGTGLGLAIAREIVDLHGGQIEVVSDGVAGRGTTFQVWLPAGEK